MALTCTFGALTPELIARSLLGCDSTNKTVNIRVVVHTGITELTPIACGSMEDFWINLRGALVIANDNQIALNVKLVTYDDGAGLSTCGICANGFSWGDYLNAPFSKDAEGNVYLNLANVA